MDSDRGVGADSLSRRSRSRRRMLSPHNPFGAKNAPYAFSRQRVYAILPRAKNSVGSDPWITTRPHGWSARKPMARPGRTPRKRPSRGDTGSHGSVGPFYRPDLASSNVCRQFLQLGPIAGVDFRASRKAAGLSGCGGSSAGEAFTSWTRYKVADFAPLGGKAAQLAAAAPSR